MAGVQYPFYVMRECVACDRSLKNVFNIYYYFRPLSFELRVTEKLKHSLRVVTASTTLQLKNFSRNPGTGEQGAMDQETLPTYRVHHPESVLLGRER